jgi:integrase/recombinase XerD
MASQLAPVMERYLAVREALGFSTRAARPLLHEFLAFLEGQQGLEVLPARVAFEWAGGAAAPRAVTSQAARLRAVRGVLTYAKASLPAIEVPESGLLGGLRRPHPYLFSPADLSRLLDAATHLSSRRAWAATTYPTLLGLLASCGLRVGEALRLQLHDVALETTLPHLQIRHPKFRKM